MLYTEQDVSRLARILNNGRATKLSLLTSNALLDHYKHFKTVCHLTPTELQTFPRLSKSYFQNFIMWRAERLDWVREKLKHEALTPKSRSLREYCDLIFKGSTHHGLRVFALNRQHHYQDDSWVAFAKNYTQPELWYRDVVKYALDQQAYALIMAFNKLDITEDNERFILEELQNYLLKLPVLEINLLGILCYNDSQLVIL